MDNMVNKEPSSCLGLQWVSSIHSSFSGLYWTPKPCNNIGGYVCKKPIAGTIPEFPHYTNPTKISFRSVLRPQPNLKWIRRVYYISRTSRHVQIRPRLRNPNHRTPMDAFSNHPHKARCWAPSRLLVRFYWTSFGWVGRSWNEMVRYVERQASPVRLIYTSNFQSF